MTYELETLKWCFSSDTGISPASCINVVGTIVDYTRVRSTHVLLDVVLARLDSTVAKLHTQLRSCTIDPPRRKIGHMLLIAVLRLVRRWWLPVLILLWLPGRVHRNTLVRISLEGWLL